VLTSRALIGTTPIRPVIPTSFAQPGSGSSRFHPPAYGAGGRARRSTQQVSEIRQLDPGAARLQISADAQGVMGFGRRGIGRRGERGGDSPSPSNVRYVLEGAQGDEREGVESCAAIAPTTPSRFSCRLGGSGYTYLVMARADPQLSPTCPSPAVLLQMPAAIAARVRLTDQGLETCAA